MSEAVVQPSVESVIGDLRSRLEILERISNLRLDTGGLIVGIRFGTQTLTFPGGSPDTNFPTVTHGLGRTPVAILVTANAAISGGLGKRAVVLAVNPTSTTFQVGAQANDLTSPGAGETVPIAWLVIG